MKKAIRLAIVIFTTVFSLTVHAQQKPPEPEPSLLWEVSGNGLSKSSYLYGTMHMMCEHEFTIKDKVKRAFQQAEKLVLEIDFDDPAELQKLQAMATSSESLQETLSPEDYRRLDRFLMEHMGVGASQFEHSNLTTIMSAVMFKSLNCQPKMFEVELMQMAIARKMELIGLEQVGEQATLFEQVYTDEQMIEQMGYYDTGFFVKMTKMYNAENLSGLYATSTDARFMDAHAISLLLDSRNKKWVAQMPGYMKGHSIFCAVGAAHLGGENGVINLLREAGYTVKPILK